MCTTVTQTDGQLPTGAIPRFVRLPNICVAASACIIGQTAGASSDRLPNVAGRKPLSYM